jgi:hypothetical protein
MNNNSNQTIYSQDLDKSNTSNKSDFKEEGLMESVFIPQKKVKEEGLVKSIILSQQAPLDDFDKDNVIQEVRNFNYNMKRIKAPFEKFVMDNYIDTKSNKKDDKLDYEIVDETSENLQKPKSSLDKELDYEIIE